MNIVSITLYSDFVCPWCYVGEHRLRRALAAIPTCKAEIRWLPFQLNPWMPAEGMPRYDYRVLKFGTWETSLRLDAEVASVASADGLRVDFSRMTRTPNTLTSHRMMQLAADCGRADELARNLFSAYFAEGIDLSAPSQLQSVALQSGLPHSEVDRLLSTDAYANQVKALEEKVLAKGLRGVPFFQIGKRSYSGAVPVVTLTEALIEALAGIRENEGTNH